MGTCPLPWHTVVGQSMHDGHLIIIVVVVVFVLPITRIIYILYTAIIMSFLASEHDMHAKLETHGVIRRGTTKGWTRRDMRRHDMR